MKPIPPRVQNMLNIAQKNMSISKFRNEGNIEIERINKMRDPNRLDEFYNTMKILHKACFPDLRYGQLCSNFFGWLMGQKNVDLFFPEEDKMIEYFREYCKENSSYFDTTNYENSN